MRKISELWELPPMWLPESTKKMTSRFDSNKGSFEVVVHWQPMGVAGGGGIYEKFGFAKFAVQKVLLFFNTKEEIDISKYVEIHIEGFEPFKVQCYPYMDPGYVYQCLI